MASNRPIRIIIRVTDMEQLAPKTDYRCKLVATTGENEYLCNIHPNILDAQQTIGKFVESLCYVINNNFHPDKSHSVPVVFKIFNATEEQYYKTYTEKAIQQYGNKVGISFTMADEIEPEEDDDDETIEDEYDDDDDEFPDWDSDEDDEDEDDDDEDDDEYNSIFDFLGTENGRVRSCGSCRNRRMYHHEDEDEYDDEYDDDDYDEDEDDEDDDDYEEYLRRKQKRRRREIEDVGASKASRNKKMRKSIKKHDVIVYHGKSGKKIMKHDEEIFKAIIKEMYPGNQKYMKRFRKHLLERIMRNAMIHRKDFEKLVAADKRKKASKGKKKSSSKTTATVSIPYSLFLDPNK